MIDKTSRRATAALALAVVAVFFSLGGAGYAKQAVVLINGKSIKKGTIRVDRLTTSARRALAGTTGPQGPKGDVGPGGIQGSKGDQGIQGSKGDQGIQGSKGDQGIQGPPAARIAMDATSDASPHVLGTFGNLTVKFVCGGIYPVGLEFDTTVPATLSYLTLMTVGGSQQAGEGTAAVTSSTPTTVFVGANPPNDRTGDGQFIYDDGTKTVTIAVHAAYKLADGKCTVRGTVLQAG